MKEQVLYGTLKGAPKWKEQILSTKPELFDLVAEKAYKDGYRNIRVATIDLSTPPDFTKMIR